jgi:glycosyltransferase involved in cell wall biosynthesis
VIAKQAGGSLETVLDGVTGCFWSGGVDELASAVRQFDDTAVDPQVCMRNASRFDAASFRRGLLAEIEIARSIGSRATVNGRQPLASTRIVRRAVRDPHR